MNNNQIENKEPDFLLPMLQIDM